MLMLGFVFFIAGLSYCHNCWGRLLWMLSYYILLFSYEKNYKIKENADLMYLNNLIQALKCIEVYEFLKLLVYFIVTKIVGLMIVPQIRLIFSKSLTNKDHKNVYVDWQEEKNKIKGQTLIYKSLWNLSKCISFNTGPNLGKKRYILLVKS